MALGPLEIYVDCDEPGCTAETAVWSGNPMEIEEVVYTTPEGWYINDEERVACCPAHRKHGR